MKKTNTALILAAVAMATLALAATSGNAASIGVNFGRNQASDTLASTDTAGVVAQDNWNNRLGGGSGASQVWDDSGGLLTTTVAVSTPWNHYSGSGTATADHKLMSGNLDGNNTSTLSATFNGIPYAEYDVYVYFDGSNGGDQREGTYTVDGNAKTGIDLAGATFSGTFIEDTGNGGNYLKWSGLTNPNIVVVSAKPIDGPDPVDRAPMNAIQIVEATAPPTIPEPMTMLAVGMSVAGLGRYVRKRRRA